MLESISSNNIFEYKKLSPEEQKQRGILGRLVGVMADSKNPTRNGRKYSAELWEKVFQNPIMREKIENRVCFGEACHPTDGREEVDPEKVAICLAEVPKINSKGQLIGVFDVLDTPCGRILKTMLDYGANIGVSSRGSGDLVTDYDGEESVDPDSYDCVCWDAVFVPAVKEARLKLVTESYGGKTLKQALTESINNASDNDKKVMQETLNDMNIKLNESAESVRNAMDKLKDYLTDWYSNNIAPETIKDVEEAGWDEEVQEAWLWLVNLVTRLNEANLSKETCCDNIDEDTDTDAVDDGEAGIRALQHALKENNRLATTITKLQEKLSVSYAKEADLQTEIDKYSRSIKKLSEQCKQVEPLKTKVSSLTEQLSNVTEKYEKNLDTMKDLRKNLREQMSINDRYKNDNSSKDRKIHQLNEDVKSLETKQSSTESKLNEKLNDLQSTLNVKTSEYSKKLEKANTLVEKYKSVANKAVDRYIESQARMLGIDAKDIKNRLSESYSFNEIDMVCDELREYKLSMNKLPFRASNLNENMKFKATPSKNESILPADDFNGDEVDEQLKSLAGL